MYPLEALWTVESWFTLDPMIPLINRATATVQHWQTKITGSYRVCHVPPPKSLMKFPFVIKTVASLVFSRKLLCHQSCTNKIKPFLISRKLYVPSSLRSQQEVPAWGSKRHKNKQKLKIQFINIMADPKIEEVLAPFRASVKEQVIGLCQILYCLQVSNVSQFANS